MDQLSFFIRKNYRTLFEILAHRSVWVHPSLDKNRFLFLTIALCCYTALVLVTCRAYAGACILPLLTMNRQAICSTRKSGETVSDFSHDFHPSKFLCGFWVKRAVYENFSLFILLYLRYTLFSLFSNCSAMEQKGYYLCSFKIVKKVRVSLNTPSSLSWLLSSLSLFLPFLVPLSVTSSAILSPIYSTNQPI
jgi:hypothetical protein